MYKNIKLTVVEQDSILGTYIVTNHEMREDIGFIEHMYLDFMRHDYYPEKNIVGFTIKNMDDDSANPITYGKYLKQSTTDDTKYEIMENDKVIGSCKKYCIIIDENFGAKYVITDN